ncbi:MAG TPA: hypothetical protein VEY92_08630 [Pseudoxanthomonas sp.]|nr:hypothetical protein [Pseudoxanthomonas sp.]
MTKHTPGPWEWVCKWASYSLVASNGQTVADDGSAGNEYSPSIDPGDNGESGANARLIAAAPDLLEALKEAMQSLEYVHRAHPENTGIAKRIEDINRARAAIAKATGESE